MFSRSENFCPSCECVCISLNYRRNDLAQRIISSSELLIMATFQNSSGVHSPEVEKNLACESCILKPFYFQWKIAGKMFHHVSVFDIVRQPQMRRRRQQLWRRWKKMNRKHGKWRKRVGRVKSWKTTKKTLIEIITPSNFPQKNVERFQFFHFTFSIEKN